MIVKVTSSNNGEAASSMLLMEHAGGNHEKLLIDLLSEGFYATIFISVCYNRLNLQM